VKEICFKREDDPSNILRREISSDVLVKDLKKDFEEIFRIPHQNQVWKYKEIIILDETPLDLQRINDNEMIIVGDKRKNSVEVNFHGLPEESFSSSDFPKSSTILDIKRIISDKYNVPIRILILSTDQEIPDNTLLSQISHNEKITLHVQIYLKIQRGTTVNQTRENLNKSVEDLLDTLTLPKENVLLSFDNTDIIDPRSSLVKYFKASENLNGTDEPVISIRYKKTIIVTYKGDNQSIIADDMISLKELIERVRNAFSFPLHFLIELFQLGIKEPLTDPHLSSLLDQNHQFNMECERKLPINFEVEGLQIPSEENDNLDYIEFSGNTIDELKRSLLPNWHNESLKMKLFIADEELKDLSELNHTRVISIKVRFFCILKIDNNQTLEIHPTEQIKNIKKQIPDKEEYFLVINEQKLDDEERQLKHYNIGNGPYDVKFSRKELTPEEIEERMDSWVNDEVLQLGKYLEQQFDPIRSTNPITTDLCEKFKSYMKTLHDDINQKFQTEFNAHISKDMFPKFHNILQEKIIRIINNFGNELDDLALNTDYEVIVRENFTRYSQSKESWTISVN